jgi:hypothetical protein
MISLVSTGTLLGLALFPLLAIGTLLFVVWVLALTVVLLRSSTRTGSWVAPRVDDAGRAYGEFNEMIGRE